MSLFTSAYRFILKNAAIYAVHPYTEIVCSLCYSISRSARRHFPALPKASDSQPSPERPVSILPKRKTFQTSITYSGNRDNGFQWFFSVVRLMSIYDKSCVGPASLPSPQTTIHQPKFSHIQPPPKGNATVPELLCTKTSRCAATTNPFV